MPKQKSEVRADSSPDPFSSPQEYANIKTAFAVFMFAYSAGTSSTFLSLQEQYTFSCFVGLVNPQNMEKLFESRTKSAQALFFSPRKKKCPSGQFFQHAERAGFEPAVRLLARHLSKVVHSTALPPLRTHTLPKNSHYWEFFSLLPKSAFIRDSIGGCVIPYENCPKIIQTISYGTRSVIF